MNQAFKSSPRFLVVTFFVISLLFSLYVNGALPFIASPTLGQAIWTTGFSQSFHNESLFTIYAHNFGAPEPAAIAFGLAGAWPTAFFISLGMHAVDAYSSMIALWLSIAFFSAYKLGLMYGATRLRAVLAALAWCTMPMVWNHSGYSMVSTGIALLPLYFLAAIRLFTYDFLIKNKCSDLVIKNYIFYFLVCILSIFMDGYTFMMFASGASLLGMWMFISEASSRKKVLIRLLVHFVSFGFAYFVYVLYIGKTQFDAAQLDFFRGWGVDLSFFVIPTMGIHWLPDFLGWSMPRSDDVFFGDSSVWTTTFALPVIIGAFLSAVLVRKKSIKCPLIFICLFGLYMALGPSVKFNSVIPSNYSGGPTMEEGFAIAPTGSELLSKYLPGFKNMRASYRWGALGFFGAWSLMVLAASQSQKKSVTLLAFLLFIVLVAINLPNVFNKYAKDVLYRDSFLEFDLVLVNEMGEYLNPGDRVAFLPWRNDFLVNYISARLDLISYNIGGDKNLFDARQNWPPTMLKFPFGSIHNDFIEDMLLLLARDEADAVVIPYFDTLKAAHHWPPVAEYLKELSPLVSELKSSNFVDVVDQKYYSIIRLKPQYQSMIGNASLEPLLALEMCFKPVCLHQSRFLTSTFTQVGELLNGSLVSNGNEGFLHFGPYVPFDAGSYYFELRGEIGYSTSPWVDIVSDKGAVQHARFNISEQAEDSGIIAEGYVEIDSQVQDLEVRIFVDEQDYIIVNGYELSPIESPEIK